MLLITQARVRECFAYRADGALVKSSGRHGNTGGTIAGSLSACGYLKVMVDGRQYLVHRLVFLLHHGYLPVEVDHIDGNKTNNRIENLRAANESLNGRNRKTDRRSRTGIKNVHYDSRKRRYGVRLCIDGKSRRFGTYSTSEEAAAVATTQRNIHFGEFANHGQHDSGVR